MSRAILFAHPGGEHVPSRRNSLLEKSTGEYGWNDLPQHRRKFLLVGATIAVPSGRGYRRTARPQKVGLWGEWEPPSQTGWFPKSPDPLLPRVWHRPISNHSSLRTGVIPPAAQNTDPWIFGRVMRYSNCRQQRLACLRRLEPGDILFFGSLMRRDSSGERTGEFNFFLDTVFVVDSAHPYGTVPRLSPAPAADVDRLFRRAVLDRLPPIDASKLRLYNGRMMNEDTDIPFCWVPCQPLDGGKGAARFPRPMINQLFDLTLGRNPRIGLRELQVDATIAWRRVVEHCRAQGLGMAVEVDLGASASRERPA